MGSESNAPVDLYIAAYPDGRWNPPPVRCTATDRRTPARARVSCDVEPPRRRNDLRIRSCIFEGGNRRMRSSVVRAVAALVLGVSLVGCSSDNAAVCGSVDNLKTSVDSAKKIDVTSSTGISDLQNGLAAVDTNLAQVKTDAKSQFSSELTAVDTAYNALKTSLTTAKSDPAAATLVAAASASQAFVASVETLSTKVKSTC